MARDRDLSQAVEENVSAFLLAMGEAGGGVQRSDEDVAWTVGGSPIGYHNAVVRCDASEPRVATLVEEWLDELRGRGLPGSWHVSPSMPIAIVEQALALGFVDGGEEPAMAVPLRGLADVPARSGDQSVSVAAVDTDDLLEEYRAVLAGGFGEGPPEADWVASVFRETGLGDDGVWRHYVGRLDGDAVATATLFLTPPVAGVYFVCTSPGWRRRGIGGAVTRYVLGEAAKLGCELGVLGSSPMGQSVYERLGFREVFRYRLLEWEPDSA